jgi:putative ABC transport system substrate-binding protein
MRRREFIAGAASATAWPMVARAQALPVIGFLNTGSSDKFAPFVNAFRQGLNDGGYVLGQNVAIEYRWADGQSARLPELAADLVRHRVSLIAATGGSGAAHAAKAATTTLPVLFIGGPDPVADGLVSSLNSPSGNLTGVAMRTSELMGKRLELLLQLIPRAAKIALLSYPMGVDAGEVATDFETTIRALGIQPILLKANSESELKAAFESAVQQQAAGVLVTSHAFFTNQRSQIVALAASHALPAAYAWREFAEAGGLVSYGPSIAWAYRQIGLYASRILKGEKIRELPVQMPTKFEGIISLSVAKALGISIPRRLLAGMDEIID